MGAAACSSASRAFTSASSCASNQAAQLDVHVMTYALGDGADAAVTKQLA